MDARGTEDQGSLRAAYEARGRLLSSQRWSLADRLADLQREVSALREEVRWLEGRVREREEELASIRASRSFRYAEALRSVFPRGRRRR